MENNKQELKKNLGISTAMATVVGCVIGSGVFLKPQAIYTATGGVPGLGMIAWLITGLVCIAAAMTFAEVAIMIPKTGGMVAYLEEAFGRKVGFLAGWMQTILSCYDRSPFSSICPAGSIVRRGWFDPARSNCSNYYRYHFEWSGLRSRRWCTGSIYRL